MSEDARSYTNVKWRVYRRIRTDLIAKLGAVIVVFSIAMAAFSIVDDFLLSELVIETLLHDPYELNPNNRLAEPSLAHPFGTDEQGRDILARVIYGTRTSIIVGVGSVLFAAIIGVSLGIVTAYYGGLVDNVGMRAMDVLLAFPAILLAIALLASLGRGFTSIIIALGVAYVPSFARVTRSKALSVKSDEYVTAAEVMGYPTRDVLVDEILPNCFTPIIVQGTFTLAVAIIAEAGLSFLGLGVNPPTPTWGIMLSGAQQYITTAWWYSLFPGLAIMVTVLGFNLLGDSIRDALDPQSGGEERRL
ncbi:MULTISPECIES: ABC transporter permease [Halolamina]|uniref:Peptide/nickel transport system permease protein n=1 Tax=Halolamina pelagica TaxID=699431 RepID=A0A1I5W9C9_9EURY|nr:MULTISPECIES: ABC transporter permease [Halolamina]NHX37504.1 ABC transporter permease [Halolamina sp. R1-12]SFQ16279.1 peptide/nickel transport system permease protein [Halolamina pelagica]